MNITDKMAVLQVLGGLIKNPMLFMDNNYSFSTEDFPEQFHKIVFGAIEHLASQGLEKICPIDIDQFLASYTQQYKVFCDNNGIEYVTKITEVVEDNNFNYYYNVFKKFSLLNKLSNSGFDISSIYDPNLTDPVAITNQRSVFDKMTLNDLIEQYESKLLCLKQEYGSANGTFEEKAGDGLEELIAELEKTPEFGVSLVSPKLTTICRGRRLKKFYIESAAQGIGKSRRAAGEACHLSVGNYYNTKTNQWEQTGMNESVLLISTELELSEVQTMFLSYVSGVPEDHILDGNYDFGKNEKNRVLEAAKYIKNSKLFFVQITDFDVDDIENLIKKYHYLYNVQYVFYDYLSTSMKVLAGTAKKARVSDLKEYQILNLFGQRLKALCNTLDIHIQTATQLSGDWKNSKDPDQSLLRGAKALADQPDIGSILLPVREIDTPVIESYLSKGFEQKPNMVIHVYKTRRTGYNNVKLYVYFDRSTCRMEDCFATDGEGRLLDIVSTNVDVILENTKSTELPKELLSNIEF